MRSLTPLRALLFRTFGTVDPLQERYNKERMEEFKKWVSTSSLYKMSWTLTPSVNTIMSTVLPGSRPKNLRELALKANPRCVCVRVWVGSGGCV